jgi:chaperonin cofactor prefoldin
MTQGNSRKELKQMADGCLNFAEHETGRLNMEIVELQEEICLHNETKAAWDTIVRNAGSESDAACLDLAESQKERLDRRVEAVQEKIRLHNETKDAWDMIERNGGSAPRIFQGTSYEMGEDGQWHVQRLNMEIAVLQEDIRNHNATKDAWDTVVRNAGGESQAAGVDFANSAKEQLDKKIEALQEKISRRTETRDAWDTIIRNAKSESRTYLGSTYVMGEDRLWHLQRTPARESNEEAPETEGYRSRTTHAVPKVNSIWNSLLDACDRALTNPQKGIVATGPGKEQFLSLGLR